MNNETSFTGFFSLQVIEFFNAGKAPNWIVNWVKWEHNRRLIDVLDENDLKILNQEAQEGLEALKACVSNISK